MIRVRGEAELPPLLVCGAPSSAKTHRDGPQPGQRGTRPPCTEPFVAESLAGRCCLGGPRTKFHPRFSPVDPAVELKSGKLERGFQATAHGFRKRNMQASEKMSIKIIKSQERW